MSNLLSYSIVLMFIASLALSGVHYYLWTRSLRRKYLLYWAIGWLVYSFRFLFDFLSVAIPSSPFPLFLTDTATSFSAALLLYGILHFHGKAPAWRRFLWVLPVGTSLWSLTLHYTGHSGFLPTLPSFLFNGLVSAGMGLYFLRSQRMRSFKSSRVFGVSMFVWGVHRLNYPVLRGVEWFAPFGYLAGTVFGLISAASMQALAFEQVYSERNASRKRYQFLFEKTHDIILIVDRDGKIIDANNSAVETYGYTYQELTRLSLFNLHSSRHDLEVNQLLNEVDQQGRLFEAVHYRKDGTPIPVEVSSVGMDLGDQRALVSIIRDISERKKVEELAIRSRDFYLSLFEDFPALIWRSNSRGQCNYINRSWSLFTGMDVEQAAGEGWLEAVHPEDRNKCYKAFADALAARITYQIEYRLRRHDGEYRWVINIGKPFYDLEEQFAGFIGSAYDVTDQRIYQQQLHETKESLRVTLQSIGDAVIATDVYGKITLMNSVAQELTGWSQEEAEGSPLGTVFNIVSEITGQPGENPVERVLSSGRIVELANHTALIAKDGTWRSIADSAAPITDDYGTLQGVVLVFRDVTADREAEQKLRKVKNQYKATFENTGTAMMIVENDMIISLANKQLALLTGYSCKELEGKMTWADLVHEKDRSRMVEYHYQRRSGQNPPKAYEFSMRNRLGETLEVLCTVEMIPGTTQSVASWMDITERKRSEDEIKYLSFHDKVTGLFNRAYFEAELERLDTIRQLPLSVIMGDVNGLKLVNDGFGHKAGDQLLQQIAHILRQACREEDVVARWGGDEFIILLPQTSEKIAQEITHRIKEACRNIAWDSPVKLSISLGEATKEKADQSLEELVHLAEDRMYRQKLMETRSFRNSLIASLKNSLKERDYETEEHALRLQDYALEVGKIVGLNENQLNELALLAALHDIGKLGIPDSILTKPGPLSKEEWVVMKKHPEIGYRIASAAPDLAPIAESILAHHERVDGAGYPRGLKGEGIPLIARILTVVDSYDVMTHERPYKEAMSQEEAIAELKRCSGSQFDPDVVSVFLDVIQEAAAS